MEDAYTKLERITANGPNRIDPGPGNTDGWCEHWIVDGKGERDPAKMTKTNGWGNREGDRDCTNPGLHRFVQRSTRGKVVNRFRACHEHKGFIALVGAHWEPADAGPRS